MVKQWQNLQHKIVKSFLDRYLLEANPKESLAPLLAPTIAAYLTSGIWILGVVTLVFWPQKELHTYLFKNEIPLNFLIVCEILLLGSAYLNLICGHGEIIIEDTQAFYQRPVVTLEESKNFFTYGLIKFLIQTFIILIPFFPFMMIAAVLVQMPWSGIVRGVIIIYSFSLLCRLLGFLAYLIWGRGLAGYYSSRLFILVFLGGTFYYVGWVNPIVLIYDLHQKANQLVTTSINSYTVYLIFMITMILLLSVINQFLIQWNLSQEK